ALLESDAAADRNLPGPGVLFSPCPLDPAARRLLTNPSQMEITTFSGSEADRLTSFANALGLLWVLGTPIDFRPLFESRQAALLTLPPTPLETESYWVLEPAQGESPAYFSAQPDTLDAPRCSENVNRKEIASRVLGAVAKISAFPRSAIKPTQSLMGDLGFDSLMTAALDAELGAVFSGVDAGPRDLIGAGATIDDVVDYLERALSNAAIPRSAKVLAIASGLTGEREIPAPPEAEATPPGDTSS